MWRFLLIPVLSLAPALAPTLASAKPEPYALNLRTTQVGFTWYLGKDAVKGDIPVSGAKVLLDFARPGGSRFTVSLDARAAKAGFLFATQAMRGPKMLDTAQYPAITFRATKVSQKNEVVHASGTVTIHGVAKPMTMTARFYRQADKPAGNRKHLIVLLDGRLDRTAFGVDGWPKIVGDQVDLHIRAVLDRTN